MVNLVDCSSSSSRRVSAVSWLTIIFMTVFVLLAHQVSLGQSAVSVASAAGADGAQPNGQYMDELNDNNQNKLILGKVIIIIFTVLQFKRLESTISD